MSLGQPVNWGAPIQSPAAQPEYFRYQGDGYVRMGDGKILSLDNHLRQQSALQRQAWVDAANRYDPSAPTQMAARAMEAQPYKSPTTNQPISRQQFFAEHRQLDTQARSRAAAAYQQHMATARSAWDTPLPRGVTVDMIPTGGGRFAPAPSGGSLAPLRSPADQRAGFTPLPRSAAVSGEALRQPLNIGVKPPGQPLLAKPGALASAGQGVLYGGGAAAGAWMGGAGFWEGAGAGLGGALGGVGGGLAGAAAGGAAGGTLGTIPAPIVGTVSGAVVGGYLGGGIGAGIGGGLGASLGGGLGRAIDNLIPDFFGGPEDYPNALPTEAMDAGPEIESADPIYGPPAFTGGQGQGVLYTIRYTIEQINNQGSQGWIGGEVTGVIPSVQTYGPISGLSKETGPAADGSQGPRRSVSFPGTARNATGGTIQIFLNMGGTTGRLLYPWEDWRVSGLTVSRADGQPDQFGNGLGPVTGNTEPVRAPNQARQPAAAGTPRALPSPLPPPAPSDLPWPESPAQATPDTAPLAPPAPVPNFTPTPTPEPPPAATPGTTPAPTDLEAPRETPPNLGEDPLTPPVKDPLTPLDKATPTSTPKSPLVALNHPLAPLAVAIPVVILDGVRQRVNTPTGSLITPTSPNTNVQRISPPVIQGPPTSSPTTFCRYEQDRVTDIQTKTTNVQEQASNPVSGFPGLYGIGIESRVKLGQTFDLLGNVDQFAKKAWEATRIQKAINALTLMTTVHNAYYLSRDVSSTLGEMISLLLDTVGIDDEAGNPLDINTLVANKVKDAINAALGEKLATNIGNSLTKASRIYQSASNVIWTLRNLTDSTTDLLEIAANNTGKIGNALKLSRVVDALSYRPMSENYKAGDATRRKTQRILDGLEQADDTIGTLYAAVAGTREIQEEIGELGQAKTRLLEDIGTLPPRDDVPANAPIQSASTEAKEASQAPNANPIDLEPADGTP